MTGILNMLVRGGGAAAFSPTSTESANFLTRATGITSTVDKTRYDALISGLVTDSIFAKLDILYIWAAPDRATAQLNLISTSYPAVENGITDGSNFAAYQGYTGDHSVFYLDSGFNPFAVTTLNYVRDSASLGVYVFTDTTSGAANGGNADAAGGAAVTRLSSFYFGSANWIMNDADTSFAQTPASSSSKGQWIITRTASNAKALYRNGSTTPFDTGTSSSTAAPQDTFKFFAADFAPTSSQMSAGYVGGGLTASQASLLAGRINTFMTAYGINVY